MAKSITAKTIHKLAIHQAPERPDLAILEIQVSGETTHYSVPRASLRNLAEGLLKEVARLEADEGGKPN